MDTYEFWEKALKNTEVIRPRIQSLMTFSETTVPYILLSESAINLGDTVVRKGEVVVERPALILPPNIPQFEGFEFEDAPDTDTDSVMNFLFVRGIQMPSMKYNNKTYSLDIYEGKLSKAITHYHNLLKEKENVNAGLLCGPEDCWQYSVLIYICSQIIKNAQTDISKLLKEFKRKHES